MKIDNLIAGIVEFQSSYQGNDEKIVVTMNSKSLIELIKEFESCTTGKISDITDVRIVGIPVFLSETYPNNIYTIGLKNKIN